jgi:hypothetical protein
VNHGVVEGGLALLAMYATRQVRGGRLLTVRESCTRCFFMFESDTGVATPLVDSLTPPPARAASRSHSIDRPR